MKTYPYHVTVELHSQEVDWLLPSPLTLCDTLTLEIQADGHEDVRVNVRRFVRNLGFYPRIASIISEGGVLTVGSGKPWRQNHAL